MQSETRVLVVGAGAFGGWTALNLQRRGARVTLCDAWGPGNSRSSSGGESRILRGTYGPDQPYTKMAARARQLWREHQQQWGCRLFHQTGVLWMTRNGDDDFERASLPLLHEAGIRYEELSAREMGRRWPQINLEDVGWGVYEPDGGFLLARTACQRVVTEFLAAGGEYKQLSVLPEDLEEGLRNGVALSDGSRLSADAYVFACGPWLGKLFHETLGRLIRPTRQEVIFFGPPPGDNRFSEPNLPVWADHGERFMYGMPASDGRGFKVADDTRGPTFDPTSGDRTVNSEALTAMRDYVGFRFPGMKDAPVIETRVCQYEDTPDGNFIIDHHPVAENVWIVGGGSGHGFKHGPALGEMVADLILEGKEADPLFRLGRFQK